MEGMLSSNDKRVRFKEYRCIFPGCTEGLKTKYNAISHIWDIHLRHIHNTTEPYKTLKDKDKARELCMPYLHFVKDAETTRKRKPYDLADVLNGKDKTVISDLVDNSSVQGKSEGKTLKVDISENSPQFANTLQTENLNQSFDLTQRTYQQTQCQNLFQNIQQQPFNIGLQGDVNIQGQNYITQNEYGQILTPQQPQQQMCLPQLQQQQMQQQMVSTPSSLERYTTSVMGPNLSDQLLTIGNDFIKVYSITENVKRLHVYGEIFAENGFLQRSDKRSKKDIREITGALETLCKLTGKSFKYKTNTKKVQYGFIAQELKGSHSRRQL
ncbi:hypothetical protein EIN_130980, partial [Entamoeba invadens IP1]